MAKGTQRGDRATGANSPGGRANRPRPPAAPPDRSRDGWSDCPGVPDRTGLHCRTCDTCAVMLRRGDHEITRTPQSEIAQVVQRPPGLLVAIGHMTTTRTHVPYVVATLGNHLWLGQGGNRGHPFAGIGSIRTRTKHGSLNFITFCSASNLAETRCISSPVQGSSPVKTWASARPSRVHGHHLRPLTNCE